MTTLDLTTIGNAGLGVLVTLCGVVVGLLLAELVYVVRMGLRTRRFYLASVWAALRWKVLTHNLDLTRTDKAQAEKAKSRAAFGPTIGDNVRVEKKTQSKIRHPHAWVRPHPYGITARVRTIPKVGYREIEHAADWIGDAWRCERVKVTQLKPGRVEIRGFRREPLEETLDSRLVARGSDGALRLAVNPGDLGPHDDVLVGVTEDGEWVYLNLANGAHGLIAGVTRSGKSITVNTLLAAGTLMRHVELTIIDPNLGAAAPWWRTADVVNADPKPTNPTKILAEIRQEMERRKGLFWSERTDKLTSFSEECPLKLVVIDEAANYTRFPDKREREAFEAELLAVASQGAKFGIRLWIITQKPSADVLSTAVRTNLSDRICHRVDTTEDFLHAFPVGRDLDLTAADKTMPQGVSIAQVGGMRSPARMRSAFLPTEACWHIGDMLCAQGHQQRPEPTEGLTDEQRSEPVAQPV